MNSKFLASTVLATSLLFGATIVARADTIRLRDGSIIRGDIIAFGDQQFTVLVGSGERGRRSRITIYMEDVDTIEFERAAALAATNTTGGVAGVDNSPRIPATTNTPTDTATNTPPQRGVINPTNPVSTSTTSNTPASGFREAMIRVRGDATTNGWTNTGISVRQGQRLRISATGRVALGNGRYATPSGVATMVDEAKLMPTEATGALIAVIGDDNDEFIFIGNRREFVAQRDGVLFLGVNEGNLNDNTGNYDVTVGYE